MLSTTQLTELRACFPALHQNINCNQLIYLDNAATTQKPLAVLEAMDHFYRTDNANVHRAAHTLSARATTAFEAARERVRRFLNAASSDEIVWTRGTTEAINLVAASWGGSQLRAGDEILLSTLEHHANIVPWQLLAARTGAVIRVIPLTAAGTLDIAAGLALIGPRTRMLAISQVSNALGVINPLGELLAAARHVGALTLVDGAQAVGHLPVDVQALGCDFYTFSGHKVYGPTGIGVLYGRRDVLEGMPPWQGGGEMIRHVSFAGSTWNRIPLRFEAGTPPIAEAIGLAAALEFIATLPVGWREHEARLRDRLLAGLAALPFVEVLAPTAERVGVVSLRLGDIHPQDAGELLDQMGIASRVGHHCAMPLMQALGVEGTLRLSLALYNTEQEVDAVLAALARLPDFF
ncbi:aminotransferase class V-fold PLP-dependent enzyme [Pseudaeromonas sharmana]|uniref:Cysteine desulfurase n=1 Tax=Pseudaeromonas sharmana TaxID=328412 RepID=A0ABV8CN67_9GAMM